MRISVGITTFNRFEYLQRAAHSLYLSKQLDLCNIRIYDDCSTDYTVTELKQLFPDAVQIVSRSTNLGADSNMHQMFLDFLETSDEVLVIFDSDLICRPDWIPFMIQYFADTDGILSLYNSMCHRPIKQLAIKGVPFWQKEHIGAAGTILNRETVSYIVDSLQVVDGFDWAWSDLLRRQGKRLLVSEESYFQHIGLKGYNCNGFSTFDFAMRFSPIHDLNRKLLTQLVQEAMAFRMKPRDEL